ncbi:MAG: hypothetical protein KF851_17905 [Pirellulaceae bacterium]|nr:hypothetical protein [Pirellulaceae bacterium]
MDQPLKIKSVFLEAISHAWRNRKLLLSTAFFHRLLALILLWPLLGWFLRRLVQTSGESVLTDEAIAHFLLSPLGAAGSMLCAVIGIAIIALEQSSLIAQSFAFRRGMRLTIPSAIKFSLSRVGSTILLIFQVLVFVMLILAPCLGVITGTAWFLLGDHDINFYLAKRPPKFYLAILVAVVVAGGGLLILLPRLASWSVALPAKLLLNLSPTKALSLSHQLLWPHRWRVAWMWCLWFVGHFVLSSIFAAAVYGLASVVVPYSTNWLTTLLITLGGLTLVYFTGNIVLSLLQAVSFAELCLSMNERLVSSKQNAESLADSASLKTRESVFDETLGVSELQSDVSNSIATQPTEKLDRRSRNWLWYAAGFGICAVISGVLLTRGVQTTDTVLVIAHRGAAGTAPENTLAAFEKAILDGADFVELDVMESADGQVVVFHDKDYMKVAGVPTKVWEATYSELATIDIGSHFDSKFNDQRTPLLVDALRLCKDRAKVIIELKDYGRGERLVERVIEIVEQERMSEQIVVMSLSLPLVRETKQARPDWTVGYLAAVSVGKLTEIDADFLAVNSKIASRSFLASARRLNKPVYVWTVDTPQSMLHHLCNGVDGIITNRPDVASKVVEQFFGLSPVERILLEAGQRIGITDFVEY